MENIKGGCLCGSVRYTANTKPIVTRACWCKLCQTIASGNATINLAFPVKAVTITGDLQDYTCIAESGDKMHRQFCPSCGVHMFTQAEEKPDIIGVRAGTLDDKELVKIEGNIWTSEAPSWAHLDPNLLNFEHQPPAPKETDNG